jgi:hypothetical protein
VARTIAIWFFGLLASAIAGWFAGSMFDSRIDTIHAFWAAFGAMLAFACLRLWLGGPAKA